MNFPKVSSLSLLILFGILAHPSVETSSIAESNSPRVNRYIVLLSDKTRGDVGATAAALTKQYGGQIHHVYDFAVRGFSIEVPETGALRIARDPRVKLLEKDSVATVMGAQSGTEIQWALDRIDQRSQPLDGVYEYTKTGAGVHAYVIDGGINFSQNGSAGTADISGRLTHGFTVAHNTAGPVYFDYFATVGNKKGHGTSVASILAGTLYGVAKGARIVNVRIVPEDGPMTASNVIAGINFAVGHHQQNPGPAVATLCLGVPNTAAVEQAIVNAIDSGIVFVLPAQQRGYPDLFTMTGAETCHAFPARLGNIDYSSPFVVNVNRRTTITVGATASNDRRQLAYIYAEGQWSSNYGPCIDIFAPGKSVKAWTAFGPGGFAGTSAATPFVAGVVALYLEGKTTYDPNEVEEILKRNATANILTDIGPGSPNLLVYSRVDEWQ